MPNKIPPALAALAILILVFLSLRIEDHKKNTGQFWQRALALLHGFLKDKRIFFK